MADSSTRRKPPSGSRSRSRSRSYTGSPSRVDPDDIKIEFESRRKPPSGSRSRSRSPSRVYPDDIKIEFESRRKPTDRGKILTRKNIRHFGSVLGMASQPFTSVSNALDTAYDILYHKRIKKGTRRDQVDTPLGIAIQIPNAYPTRRGGKKKRRKTRKLKK